MAPWGATRRAALWDPIATAGAGDSSGGFTAKIKPSESLPSKRSPTSQFEYDNATQQTLDFNSRLHKSYSDAALNIRRCKSLEKYPLTRIDEESISSDEGYGSEPDLTDSVTDFMFCRLQCAFPDMIDDMDEILSNDLHHLIFQGGREGGEDAGGEAKVAALIPLKLFGESDDTQGKGGLETVLILNRRPNEQRGGGVDEQVDGEKDSWEVMVVDEQGQDEEARLESASYSPAAGFELRKDGKLPEPSEDEVLVRVEATTLSTRDCLERLRRDINEKLQNDIWVPGHEIVGHVVSAGKNAKFLLDKRIAALMPHGGGCSQYVCINAEDAIALPEEAGSDEMVALLSTYMTAYQCLESVIGSEPEERKDDETEEEDVESEEEDEEADVKPREILSTVDDAGQTRSPLFGKNVLIVGAGSPVGLALIDLASNAGASVYALLGNSQSRLCSVREMGANHWHSLCQKKLWEEEWRGKMDLIVDKVGDADYNPSFYTVMKPCGRLVTMNITSCEKKYVPSRSLAGSRCEHGLGLSSRYKERVLNDKAFDYDICLSFDEDEEFFTEDLAYLHHLFQIGKIRPKIFSQVGFDELEDEWEKVMTGGTNGGVVIVLPGRIVV